MAFTTPRTVLTSGRKGIGDSGNLCILISCHQINLRHFDLCLLNSKAPRTHLIVSHDISKQTLRCKRHSGMVDGPVLLKSLRLLTWQLNTSHTHFCMFSHQCHRLVVRICCRKSFHPLPRAESDHSPAEERKKSHLVLVHLQDPPLHNFKAITNQALPWGPSVLQQVQACTKMSLVGPASQAFEGRALPAPVPGTDPLI